MNLHTHQQHWKEKNGKVYPKPQKLIKHPKEKHMPKPKHAGIHNSPNKKGLRTNIRHITWKYKTYSHSSSRQHDKTISKRYPNMSMSSIEPTYDLNYKRTKPLKNKYR